MLEIIDPSDWIKNTSFIVEEKNMPHRVAMSFFDENYVNQIAGIQAFNFRGTLADMDEDFLFAMQSATLQSMEKAVQDNPTITSLSVLSVHDDMEVAFALLESIMKVPAFLNLEIAAAIATDQKVWFDLLFDRVGPVDLEKTTVFELRQLFDEDNLSNIEGEG